MPMFNLIVNACVAFTGFYLISKIYHSHLFNSLRLRSVLMGTLAGLIGLFLMVLAVEVNEEVRIDLRHLPAILLAFYGARLPLFIATSIIASSRLLFGINDQAIIAFIGSFVASIVMLWIHRKLSDRMLIQSMALNIWALSLISFGVWINLGFGITFLSLLLTIWGVGLSAGLMSSALTIDLETTTKRAKEYRYSAERDYLTGLFNRRAWEQATSDIELENRIYNVMILDIDHFKHVNDRYGHASGDQVLKRFAELLLLETRPQDLVARIGGEEFVVLIRDLPTAKIKKIAERIRVRIEYESFVLPQEILKITVSIGVSSGQSISIEQLLDTADQALYQAKNTGRNRTVLEPVSRDSLAID